MKPLSLPARQMRQRRINAYYMMPDKQHDQTDQLEIGTFPPHEDRPRTLREMFADYEMDNDDPEQ